MRYGASPSPTQPTEQPVIVPAPVQPVVLPQLPLQPEPGFEQQLLRRLVAGGDAGGQAADAAGGKGVVAQRAQRFVAVAPALRRRSEEKADLGNVALMMLVTGQAERGMGEPVAHHQAQPVFIPGAHGGSRESNASRMAACGRGSAT